MKRSIRRQPERAKQKFEARLAPFESGIEPRAEGQPELSGPRPTYEIAERGQALPCGGIAAIHEMVREVGLPRLIDQRLGILKRARPCHDSDRVLNIAYNVLCGGIALDDIEHRRNDAALLDMMGARAISPRPPRATAQERSYSSITRGRSRGSFWPRRERSKRPSSTLRFSAQATKRSRRPLQVSSCLDSPAASFELWSYSEHHRWSHGKVVLGCAAWGFGP